VLTSDSAPNIANGCNPIGSVSVGWAASPEGITNAVYWNPTLHAIGGSYGGENSAAFGCDQTGTYITGLSAAGAPVVWISGTGTLLPTFAGAMAVNGARGISADATTIIGFGTDGSDNTTAVKWVWSGAGPPPTTPPTPPAAPTLNMANVVVTSLAAESPCTAMQFPTPPPANGAATVGLRWSDTRGAKWNTPVAQALGTDPFTQLQWNRTGYARDRVFELFWSAGLNTALNGAFILVEPWKS
jgi:hypothetical protein